MTPELYLDQIAVDSARFASAAAGSLDQEIDFIDGWVVHDLVGHLGQVYSFVIANTSQLGSEVSQPGDEANPPEGEAINEWFAERRTTLLATLSSVDPSADAWTFMGIQPAAWWIRRMTHETSVHRWDAEAATHGPDAAGAIDGEMAVDGVEEYMAFSLRTSTSRPNRVYPTESLHLHRADGPGEWMLVANGEGGVSVTHEHGKGDAAVRGSASDLLMWMWGRPVTGVEIFGDQTVADRWQQLAP